MDRRATKLVLTGIIICLIGSILAVSSVYVNGWIEASVDRNLVAGIWLAKVVITTAQFGVAPFGATLAAIGVALRWLGGSTSTGSPETAHSIQPEAGQDGRRAQATGPSEPYEGSDG